MGMHGASRRVAVSIRLGSNTAFSMPQKAQGTSEERIPAALFNTTVPNYNLGHGRKLRGKASRKKQPWDENTSTFKISSNSVASGFFAPETPRQPLQESVSLQTSLDQTNAAENDHVNPHLLSGLSDASFPGPSPLLSPIDLPALGSYSSA